MCYVKGKQTTERWRKTVDKYLHQHLKKTPHGEFLAHWPGLCHLDTHTVKHAHVNENDIAHSHKFMEIMHITF